MYADNSCILLSFQPLYTQLCFQLLSLMCMCICMCCVCVENSTPGEQPGECQSTESDDDNEETEKIEGKNSQHWQSASMSTH